LQVAARNIQTAVDRAVCPVKKAASVKSPVLVKVTGPVKLILTAVKVFHYVMFFVMQSMTRLSVYSGEEKRD